jgi:nitrite reductase/ring-hydroxylating ferredoxin subunit
MIAKQKFLNQPYGAYFHREVPKEDEDLTHVGPGTPCGEYLRRFWHPVISSAELNDLPVAIKIMCEELVVFRDGTGQVGLLELHCPHRGTSLEFGLLEKNGIRCCYHGWLFGVDGRILDTPGEPPDSTYKERLCHGAYPVHEYAGLVFAYMGPQDKQPPFPILDTYNMPGFSTKVGTTRITPCNWLQCEDNIMDPVHTSFLHTRSSGTQFTDAFSEIPRLDWMETPNGMIYMASRRVGNNIWTRMSEWIPPAMHQFPHNWENGDKEHPFLPAQTTQWSVPVDDTTTMVISLRRISDENGRDPVGEEAYGVMEGQTGGRPYEHRQRFPNDFEALVGQRPIAIHAMEHLAETDRGIIIMRNLIRQGIQAVRLGEDPKPMVLDIKPGEVVRTYANDTVSHIPPAPTPEEDQRLLRETGWKWANGYMRKHPDDSDTAL